MGRVALITVVKRGNAFELLAVLRHRKDSVLLVSAVLVEHVLSFSAVSNFQPGRAHRDNVAIAPAQRLPA